MAVDALSKLKSNAITRFQKFLKRLNKGYVDDYSMILHEIAFIQIYSNLDKSLIPLLYEYFINNNVWKNRFT